MSSTAGWKSGLMANHIGGLDSQINCSDVLNFRIGRHLSELTTSGGFR
jgi:hypothetical protein